MKRFRTLIMPSYQFFCSWYDKMKTQFTGLKLSLLKQLDVGRIKVVISY